MPRRFRRSRNWSSRSRRGRILYRARRRRLNRWAKSIRRRYRHPRFKRRRMANTIPRTQLVSMPLCRQIVIPNRSGTAGAPGQPQVGMYVITLNDLINPLNADPAALSGQQPRGRDQWYALYKNYCVIGADIKIEPLFMIPEDADSPPVNPQPFSNNLDLVAWYDTQSTAAPYGNDATFEDLIESGNKYTRVTRCSAVPSAVPLQPDPSDPDAPSAAIVPSGHSNFINLKEKKFLKLKYITKKFFDVGNAKMIQAMPRSVAPQNFDVTVGPIEEGFQRLSADRDGTPLMKAFLKMTCFHSDYAQTTVTSIPTGVVARVTIRFKVVWFNPLTLRDS